MHESLFNNKITLSTPTGLTPVKVDVIKTEIGIEVRLIDTSNIFSLWIYTLTSSDFYILKRDQDILVDYDRFVQILVNLFHGVATSKYIANFSEGILRFIENFEFRNICKLELKFTKPEETQYRRYIGDLIGRMEGDNVKLIKENSILRERCLSGDHNMREKTRFLEKDNTELRRRLDLVQRDLGEIQEKAVNRENEITKLSTRIYEIENENGHLRYEIEKYEKDNSISLRDQLKGKEEELEEMRKEINTANEIIRKLRQENSDLKQFKSENLSAVQKEADRCEELSQKLEEAIKKGGQIESKYRKAKEELREKMQKMEEMNEANRALTKKLENAQNVYNHFYSKRIDDHPDNFSDTFSLRPESPPGR